jgi:hypothetical protein
MTSTAHTVTAASLGTSTPAMTYRPRRANSNILHWSRFEEGGHFAALELPWLVAGDIRAFFATVRPAQ